MYLALGDKERAIDEMGRAYRERAGNDMALIKVDPMLDDLRSPTLRIIERIAESMDGKIKSPFASAL